MKLIAVDNLARESVADELVAENLTAHWATYLAEVANTRTGDRYFRAVPDDHRLSRGMADLV